MVDDTWGDDTVCPICLDNACEYNHNTCGRSFCCLCLTALNNRPCPICDKFLCNESLSKIPVISVLDHEEEEEAQDPYETSAAVSVIEKEEEQDPVIVAAMLECKVFREQQEKDRQAHETLAPKDRPCCHGDLAITIKSVDGQKTKRHVSPEATVKQLKACAGLSLELRIIHKGAPLNDQLSIGSQGVKVGDTLHIIETLRG